LNIPDPLFVSAPNGGGILYAHRHFLMPLLDEDATGLCVTANRLLWCVQADGSHSLREIRDGRLLTTALAKAPLDLHDVLEGPDGTYAVFTETNEVVRLNDEFQVCEKWSFGDEPDCAHVNCLAWHDGRLIASMFGNFSTHRGYKGHSRRAGRVVDVRSGEVLIEGLSQPHSLVSADGFLWLCSSEDCELQIYGQGLRLERSVALPGYARGLAVGTHAVYVGISRSRNLAMDEVGAFDNAVISVLERRTLSVLGHVPLPWNEIYDIRLAPTAFPTPEIMGSLWGYERKRTSALSSERERELSRAREMAHESSAAWELEVAARLALEQQMQASQADAKRELEVARGRQAETLGEVVKRDARIAVLELAKTELDLIKASRSWRWTRPLRFVLRTLRHRGLSPEDRRRFGRLPQPLKGFFSPRMPTDTASLHGDVISQPVDSVQKNKQLGALDVFLAPQQPHRRDFFLWAVIDWHFRIQRPQHLARELAAAGHRVFYISNNFIDRVEPGFSVEALGTEGRLFQIHLHLAGCPSIYQSIPSAAQREQLRAGIGEVLAWAHSRACASLVQHPYWLETAQILPNHRLVYDCMDHHGGFADNTQEVIARERELMRVADLLVVTSEWLQREAGANNSRCLIVRNACQYEHFCERPAEIFRDSRGRRIIGYYGALAEWFDLELLEKVARNHPDCLVLLVGADTAGARRRLGHLDNVTFTGEVAYAQLPHYLYGFDVCLLPFQVIPLTLATNPVKVYEYLSAGKNVVSIDLPEIKQFGDLVRTGADHHAFLAALTEVLRAPPDPQLAARQQEFASGQTWAHRVRDLLQGIDSLEQPKVSVIVVTYNNLDLTKVCLDSLDRYSAYPNLELIVVDNASDDGTPDYLRAWEQSGNNRLVILNSDNRGFAGGNNQGLAAASGDYLVMLNNDTHVTPGWVSTMVGHLRRSDGLGLLGPVTNNIGNEARIDIHYGDMEQMLQASGDYTARHAGQLTPLHAAAFFCVMMPRVVYERVGRLDEAFGIGMFEDDDYCRRVQQQGWSIACAEDVFIHHNLSASFNKIKQEKRQAMFEQNKAIYEAKWGAWVPHKYRRT
jgi:GT2 family glycosyltransferase/glycosyltransferase involved in cell wall biosynthesis